MVQCNCNTLHCFSQPVIAHSSYDTGIQAVHAAIDYIAHNAIGKVIVFINNQATIKLLFNTKPHSLFELSQQNCQSMGTWRIASPYNVAEFRWVPSHLGFSINELADMDVVPIGLYPFPQHTIASRIRFNRSLVIIEWRNIWSIFANMKAL